MPLIFEKLLPKGGLPVRDLQEYLSSNRTLVIPPWQREYSWSVREDEQIDTLLKDLKAFAENDASVEYLIGSVVLCQLPGEEDRPFLIDGQQRTLTFTLLLMCIRKFLKSHNLIDGQNQLDTTLDSDITKCLDSNPYGEMKAKISMKQSSADITLGQLYEWSQRVGKFNKDDLGSLTVTNATQENLIAAAEFIYKRIAGYEKKEKGLTKVVPGEWIPVERLKQATKKLLNGVKFIEISVDDKRESISVFDHINNRGLALNPADLVKNLMFERVPDKDFSTISDRWSEMCELLLSNKRSRLQDPRYLLRAISHVEYGAHEGYDKLDIFWSKKFESETEGVSAQEFSKKLPKYAKELQSLVARDTTFRGGLSSIYLSGELGSVQHFSVLLAGHKLNSDKVFQFLCHQVNIRTLIYMFAEERTQLFDSMIPAWAHDIYNLSPDAKIEDLKKVYEEIKPAESLMRDLKERMLDWSYELPSQKKKIRATLGLISTEMNELCKQSVRVEDVMRTRKSKGNPEPFHIDHILPQSKAKGNRIFHSIGNLTLLEPPANLAALDTDPLKKKDFYTQCSLILTKTLCGYDLSISSQAKKVKHLAKEINIESPTWDLKGWDEASVQGRATFIFEYFNLIAEGCWKI